ncbi:response regulator [Paenibacillus sp. KN14-4R]|uniref:response regulator n=1 Tax=Paenibacillus sp. KN14-4R TaxID=3445773 RepID=UPI003FA07D86
MKAIIVDDENLALQKMTKLLQTQDGFNVNVELIGAYLYPYEAVSATRNDAPDIAFLDIEMPEMSGFELADQLLELHPQLQVVFVTAHQDFAVKAFEVNALDYLLKPVHPTRLAMTMNRIAQSKQVNTAEKSQSTQSQLSICCLRSLHLMNQHQEMQSFPWKTLKAPELFAYLIHYRNKTVSKQSLMDLLWPEYDLHKATAQLHTAIYQIRKMMKTYNLDITIKYQDEGYRLVWGNVKLDTEQWENSLRQAPPVTPETLDQHLSIMNQYSGDFLEEHGYAWAEHEKERTRLLWIEHAKQIAQCRMLLRQHTEAITLYQRMVDKLPYREDGYTGLMQVHALLHHPGEVRRLFHQLSEQLQMEYGVLPSRELTDWFGNWEKANSYIG